MQRRTCRPFFLVMFSRFTYWRKPWSEVNARSHAGGPCWRKMRAWRSLKWYQFRNAESTHTQLNPRITPRKIKWCFVTRRQLLIAYAKRVRSDILFLVFAECKTPHRFDLCELIPQAVQLRLLPLMVRYVPARRYLCICDRMHARVLSDIKPHMRIRSNG